MNPAATADIPVYWTMRVPSSAAKASCSSADLAAGASSAMAYAVLHPEEIRGVVAIGMCDILARLASVRRSSNPLLQNLVACIIAAYGGTP